MTATADDIDVTSDERRVLVGVLRGMRAAATGPDADDLHRFGVRYSPGLIAGTDQYVPAATRVRFLEAVHDLHRRGLLVTTRRNNRLRAVRLTDAGLRLAATLADATEAAPTVAEPVGA